MENVTSYLCGSDIHHVLPYWRQIMWGTLFTLIIVIGTIGNLTVIWIVAAHRCMRTVTNLFLVNLAIADGLVAMFDVPLVAFESIYGSWPFGHNVCFLNEFFAATTIGVSIMTLSVISIERYQAIMYPLKRRMGRTKSIMIMVAIWLASIVVMSPNWIFITTTTTQVNGVNIVDCQQRWPNEEIEEIYRICVMIVSYFLPLACIGFSYGSMAVKLWGYNAIGEQLENQLKKKKVEKKIVKMLITVVSIFAVCWLPFHSLFIANSFCLPGVENITKDVDLSIYWLVFSHSMHNPIIYCLMSNRFRAGFKKAYRWCPLVRYDPVADGAKLLSN